LQRPFSGCPRVISRYAVRSMGWLSRDRSRARCWGVRVVEAVVGGQGAELRERAARLAGVGMAKPGRNRRWIEGAGLSYLRSLTCCPDGWSKLLDAADKLLTMRAAVRGGTRPRKSGGNLPRVIRNRRKIQWAKKRATKPRTGGVGHQRPGRDRRSESGSVVRWRER
jgi:hypothetical protein